MTKKSLILTVISDIRTPYNLEQVRDELIHTAAAFFAWAGLFRFKEERKASAHVL